MSKGDLIALRNDLEEQIIWLRELFEEVSGNRRADQLRIKELEEKFERLRMSVTALNNLVKGNVR